MNLVMNATITLKFAYKKWPTPMAVNTQRATAHQARKGHFKCNPSAQHAARAAAFGIIPEHLSSAHR